MSVYQKKYKVLVAHPEVPKEALDLLESSHCELFRVSNELPTKRAELLQKVKGMDALYWATHEPLNAEVLDAAGPQLKSVTTMSAGVDYVDIEEFKKRKIPLGHTPDALNSAVADLAVGLMIAAARRFHEGRQKIETPDLPRPIKVSVFLPITFIICCVVLVVLPSISEPMNLVYGVVITLAGIPFYYASKLTCKAEGTGWYNTFSQALLRTCAALFNAAILETTEQTQAPVEEKQK